MENLINPPQAGHLKEELEHQRLRNQQLNHQLALMMMKLAQKRNLLKVLKSEIRKIVKLEDKGTMHIELDRLLRRISFDDTVDENWKSFAYYFDQTNQDFLKRLSEKHPQLSKRDQQLCAFLRLNMSTKDIAPMMNISVRGVEISRYRLRKKLGLGRQYNLAEYLENF